MNTTIVITGILKDHDEFLYVRIIMNLLKKYKEKKNKIKKQLR